MIISDLQFYDISWKHRFESLSLRWKSVNRLDLHSFYIWDNWFVNDYFIIRQGLFEKLLHLFEKVLHLFRCFLWLFFSMFFLDEIPMFGWMVPNLSSFFVVVAWKVVAMNDNEWKVKWELVIVLLAITLVFAVCMRFL